MTIKAKFPSICRKCKGAIKVGDSIEWERGQSAYHTICPAEVVPAEPTYGKIWTDEQSRRCVDCGKSTLNTKVHLRYPGKHLIHVNCQEAAETIAVQKALAPYRLSGGSGYGCQGWYIGQTMKVTPPRADWPEFITVVKERSQYIREDGMSFGVGEESGHIYTADCREATPEEIAPIVARLARKEAKQEALKAINKIAEEIRETGEFPEGRHTVSGTRIRDTQNLYGGGEWFVITADHIWFVQNNGADGDDWSRNNVNTGGAGGMGWRIPYNEEIANKIIDLDKIIEDKKENSQLGIPSEPSAARKKTMEKNDHL